jgi:glutathione S-transferase
MLKKNRRFLYSHFIPFLSFVAMESKSEEVCGVPEWTLLYHRSANPFKGRGEFLRLILEDAQVPYLDTGDNLYGPQGMMDAFRGSADAVDVDNTPHPVFFPPAIWHRPTNGEEVLVNQVAACMTYLGEKLGYAPKAGAERARDMSIMLNALDYISEGRSSFHPIKNNMSYHDQKEEGDKVSKEFSKGRMLIWLHHFNKVVVKNGGPNKPIAGGTNVTPADFVLFHVLHATQAQFNSEFYDHAWDNVKVPALKEYYEWMKSRPNLQAYFESERCARKFLWKSFSVFETFACAHAFLLVLFVVKAFAGDSMM